MQNNRKISRTVSHNKYTRIQELPELFAYNKHNLINYRRGEWGGALNENFRNSGYYQVNTEVL